MSRRELTFQSHVIDTYKLEGGTGRKWSSEFQKGPPDLILSCHGVGVHLAEVKHRPLFSPSRPIQNPMTEKQVSVAKEYVSAGGLVFLFLISGDHANRSRLWVFDPFVDTTANGLLFTVDYTIGRKYEGITQKIRELYDARNR